ncbi:hypothetical protein M4951_14845 [Blastopirellula sp. J2-11]|uniref:hypothetical protein n=1 Tax=Blastopirellula sp. J2-11 TaxID=2943192 RepID=UPI0021C75B54|nr:hypothetical protein [Blastopirellula sp. J2-11]UUO04665.1 hypothetical protein M4951_14845 [Blastopirellula sp. J2-11]
MTLQTNLLHSGLRLGASLFFASILAVSAPASAADHASVGNDKIARQVSWDSGRLTTGSIANRIDQSELNISGGDEFALTVRLDGAAADLRLTAADFKVSGSEAAASSDALEVRLSGKTAPLDVTVRYFAKPGEPWMRKRLIVTARQSMRIEKVEVEHLAVDDAYAPYRSDQLTAQGAAKWRPPLGQPVYTRTSGTWWGVEFPAARNEVKDGKLVCGYLTGVDLKPGETYSSYTTAVGVSDDPDFLKDAFLDYIDVTRARPLRLQTQYNSWFDYNRQVDADTFIASVRKVNEELVVDRGIPPLRVYAIDAGWQDMTKDWTKVGVWPVNGKFDPDFSRSRQAIEQAKSSLGLWVSPGCLFGSQAAIPAMRTAGWRTLDPWMSMTGTDYMDALEDRLVQLAADDVAYFKLDGVFGHLRTRNFDIEGFKGGEQELNEAKYDDAKERYLSLGTERLMQIFKRMGEANPDVYIVISNGAYLSPWWLQHVDAVWMINAGDHARGNDRTSQLIYRDSGYFQLASTTADNTQFPLNSIFNHEPKKISSEEDPDAFRRYLLMSLSRGTGFVELYLKTFDLSEDDWDVLAEGMKWVHHMFPAFKRARMIGGNPDSGEVYGYTGWTEEMGYVSLHNPSDETREFSIVLDRTLGLPKTAVSQGGSYVVSSPLTADIELLPKRAAVGRTIAIKLPPRAIRILEFARVPADR